MSPFPVCTLACGLGDYLHKGFNLHCGFVDFKLKPWQKLYYVMVWDTQSQVFQGHSGRRRDLSRGGCVAIGNTLAFSRLSGWLWHQRRLEMSGSMWLKHHSPAPILIQASQQRNKHTAHWRYQRTLIWRTLTALIRFQNFQIHHDITEIFIITSE